MAGQLGGNASALPAAAHVVGNAFVNQYYNVLHQSPQVVHRFYTDASRLTRAEAGADGAVDTVVSQSDIHQKVMALDYGDFKAEITTVDSQDSLTGGVLVMVTGSLLSKPSGKRNFVQSFFLAPQEKGYFVLNDIFRYLDEEPHTNNQLIILPNGAPEALEVHSVGELGGCLSAEHEVVALPLSPEVVPKVEEIFNSAERVELAEVEAHLGIDDLALVETPPVIDQPPSPVAVMTLIVPPPEESSEEAPKKSYASIVSYASILRMKDTAVAPAPSTTCSTAPKVSIGPSERPVPLSGSAITPIGQENPDEGLSTENEVDGRSVYVKNLPINISSSQLEEEFGKFGLIKPGGVNVKSQKQGACYAFVEFEETVSAQTAIEMSPITIGGRQVYIEEKRPMGPRAGGRGGRVLGPLRTDRPFRSDGLRSRGTFGGRGVGSRGGGQDRDRDVPNRGRGTGPARATSGTLGGHANFVNITGVSGVVDSSRRDAQGGNGNRIPRRGGINQAPRNGAVMRGSPSVTAV